jgi:diacylglycerol kinase (ATP)
MVPPVENEDARAKGVPSRALAALRYALRGIGLLFGAPNIWVLTAASLAALGAGAWFSIAALEWCAVLLAITLVWVAEALNTALERLTDLASPQLHPLAGKAKDLAAGAVLLSAIGAVSIGFVIFGPRLF